MNVWDYKTLAEQKQLRIDTLTEQNNYLLDRIHIDLDPRIKRQLAEIQAFDRENTELRLDVSCYVKQVNRLTDQITAQARQYTHQGEEYVRVTRENSQLRLDAERVMRANAELRSKLYDVRSAIQ